MQQSQHVICIDFAFLLLRPLDLKAQIRKAWLNMINIYCYMFWYALLYMFKVVKYDYTSEHDAVLRSEIAKKQWRINIPAGVPVC